jgi:hypothetical protein
MNVDIDETWNDQTIMQLDHGNVFLGNGNNTTLVNGKVTIYKVPIQKNGSASQQQTHIRSPSIILFRFSILSKNATIVNGFYQKWPYKKRTGNRSAFC